MQICHMLIYKVGLVHIWTKLSCSQMQCNTLCGIQRDWCISISFIRALVEESSPRHGIEFKGNFGHFMRRHLFICGKAFVTGWCGVMWLVNLGTRNFSSLQKALQLWSYGQVAVIFLSFHFKYSQIPYFLFLFLFEK